MKRQCASAPQCATSAPAHSAAISARLLAATRTRVELPHGLSAVYVLGRRTRRRPSSAGPRPTVRSLGFATQGGQPATPIAA